MNLTLNRGKIHYKKRNVRMDIGGLTSDAIAETETTNLDDHVDHLPDIVSYIQKETHLTRKSIVKILTSITNLDYFKINPQKFVEACMDIISIEMQLHIVDGIKYQKMGDHEFFSQELFKNNELFGYLGRYLEYSQKSPHEYVVCDSQTESNLSIEFEQSNNISVLLSFQVGLRLILLWGHTILTGSFLGIKMA